MTTIRPMRRHEAGAVRDLWNEMCQMADSAVPGGWGQLSAESLERQESGTIWNARPPTPTPSVSWSTSGRPRRVETASIVRHPVMPGNVGEIESTGRGGLRSVGSKAAQLRDRLVEAALDWFHDRAVSVIMSRIALDAPWTSERVAFFAHHGFENDLTLVTRYQTD